MKKLNNQDQIEFYFPESAIQNIDGGFKINDILVKFSEIDEITFYSEWSAKPRGEKRCIGIKSNGILYSIYIIQRFGRGKEFGDFLIFSKYISKNFIIKDKIKIIYYYSNFAKYLVISIFIIFFVFLMFVLFFSSGFDINALNFSVLTLALMSSISGYRIYIKTNRKPFFVDQDNYEKEISSFIYS